MSALIDRIGHLIKREKTTPERQKKDDSKKTSSEILSELFGAFNADPPKIDENSLKKAKKSKKKHKKEKKRSHSSNSDSEDSDYSHKHKKKKKSKSKKRRYSVSSSSSRGTTPPRIIKPDETKVQINLDKVKKEDNKVKSENGLKIDIKTEQPKKVSIKTENSKDVINIDASMIPMPDSPKDIQIYVNDLRYKLDSKKLDDNDKGKGKIQIKNLKFSTVFEQTLKQVEEEARKRAEKYEEGEISGSSSPSEKDEPINLQFPKSADPGGILKKQADEDNRLIEDEKRRKKHSDKSKRSSRKSRERSKTRKRSQSKSRRSRSRSRRRHRKRSKSPRSRSRRRSTSRSRKRSRHHSPTKTKARRSRSPNGVKLADSEKKRLLEVARRNAINMLKNGAVPAGAAALPPHTRNQVMAAIQSGGKSVDELTDFCKHLSKKEALGELSSVTEDEMSENEDTLAFHHPFLVKEKAPIVLNIRGGAPLPLKNAPLAIANKDELRMQFPVSSGSQHREKASEWVPVSPKKNNMQVAKISQKPAAKPAPILAITDKPSVPAPPKTPPPATAPAYLKGFSSGTSLTSVPALPAPGPQAYPPGLEPQKDYTSLVLEKLSAIRREQEQSEISSVSAYGYGWKNNGSSLGQFMGSTGAQILTPKELASGTQAWAKKDQLTRAAPVAGGMGMHLLQKMGWTPGQGLGKEGTGTLQPLLLEVKLDTKGLQAKEEMSGPGGPGGQGGQRGQAGQGGQRGQAGQGGQRGQAGPGGQRGQRARGPAPGALAAGGKHPVSLLGEYCSKHKLGPPEYNLCFECGPDHKKNFLFKVKVAGVEYQPAVASANKKQAKADSAQLALQKLGGSQIDGKIV